MANNGRNVYVTTRTGKKVRLLNPAQKRAKYVVELKTGEHYTNTGQKKTDDRGHVKKLTKREAAWRSGYLQAAQDNAKAYKHNQKKKYRR